MITCQVGDQTALDKPERSLSVYGAHVGKFVILPNPGKAKEYISKEFLKVIMRIGEQESNTMIGHLHVLRESGLVVLWGCKAPDRCSCPRASGAAWGVYGALNQK